MRRGDGRTRAVLPISTVILLGCTAGGCGDWPHFTYAPGEPVEVTDQEGAGDEEMYNLEEVHDDLILSGQIRDSAYAGADGKTPPFEDVPGWYYGDIDWFQFTLYDPRAVVFELSWESPEADLDLCFLEVDPETALPVPSVCNFDRGSSGERLEVGPLKTDTIYVFAIAGYHGEAVDYTLYLDYVF